MDCCTEIQATSEIDSARCCYGTPWFLPKRLGAGQGTTHKSLNIMQVPLTLFSSNLELLKSSCLCKQIQNPQTIG